MHKKWARRMAMVVLAATLLTVGLVGTASAKPKHDALNVNPEHIVTGVVAVTAGQPVAVSCPEGTTFVQGAGLFLDSRGKLVAVRRAVAGATPQAADFGNAPRKATKLAYALECEPSTVPETIIVVEAVSNPEGEPDVIGPLSCPGEPHAFVVQVISVVDQTGAPFTNWELAPSGTGILVTVPGGFEVTATLECGQAA